MTALNRAIERTNRFLATFPDAPFTVDDVSYYAGLEMTVADNQENRAFVDRHPELRVHQWNSSDSDFEIRWDEQGSCI